MVSLRAHCALFSTVISHSMDNPLPIDQGWASLQIPTVPSTTTDSTPPSGHTDFNTALAARVEALKAKLNEANESVLTLSPPLVDNSSAPATSSTWLLLAAHPLPEHHSLPIGLFIDPSKVPTPDDLISVVISWFNQLGHPPTRLVSEDHLRTSLARLSNPYTGAWLSAIAANADQFACTWHSDSQLTGDYPILYSSPSRGRPPPLSSTIHPADALFTHPKFALAAAIFFDQLFRANLSLTMVNKFHLSSFENFRNTTRNTQNYSYTNLAISSHTYHTYANRQHSHGTLSTALKPFPLALPGTILSLPLPWQFSLGSPNPTYLRPTTLPPLVDLHPRSLPLFQILVFAMPPPSTVDPPPSNISSFTLRATCGPPTPTNGSGSIPTNDTRVPSRGHQAYAPARHRPYPFGSSASSFHCSLQSLGSPTPTLGLTCHQ